MADEHREEFASLAAVKGRGRRAFCATLPGSTGAACTDDDTPPQPPQPFVDMPLVEATTTTTTTPSRTVDAVVAGVVAGAASVEAAGRALHAHEAAVVAQTGRQALADYLGAAAHSALLQAYVAAQPLPTADFECALRHFLARVALPREAGAIGRACDAFARHYYAAAADDTLFADADAVATLTAALLILNPDQHSRAVHRRMPARAFVRWLRGANGGHDYPRWFLAALHANISSLVLAGASASAGVAGANAEQLKCGWLSQRIGLYALRRWFVVDERGLLSRRRPTDDADDGGAHAPTRYAVDTLVVVATHRRRAGLVVSAACGRHAQELRLHADCDEACAGWADAVRTCIARHAYRTRAGAAGATATAAGACTTTTAADRAARARSLTRSAAVAEIAAQHTSSSSTSTSSSSGNGECECAAVRVDDELVLHVVLLRDTARCLREARRVLVVVLRHQRVLLLRGAQTRQPFGEVVPSEVVLRAHGAGMAPPEDLPTTCRGFYVRMNHARDLALAVHWDDRAAARLARAHRWLAAHDPDTLRLFDGAPAFFARAFRSWIAFTAAAAEVCTAP